jgi:hypothetical protein
MELTDKIKSLVKALSKEYGKNIRFDIDPPYPLGISVTNPRTLKSWGIMISDDSDLRIKDIIDDFKKNIGA